MKITDLKAHILKPDGRVIFAGNPEYFKNTGWEHPQYQYGLVRMFTDDGMEGNAITHSWEYAEMCVGRFKAAQKYIVGQDPFDREKIEKTLAQTPIFGRDPQIMDPIDTCLWDIAGKATKLPIYKLIGGYRDKILAYASNSQPFPEGEKQAVDFFVECKKQGFKAIKIHPFRDPERDISLCKAVREAVGDEMILMLDPLFYGSRYEALKVGRQIEKLNFYWYEDPLPTSDIEGLADLCRSLDIPVLMGEMIRDLQAWPQYLRRGASDAVRCIIMHVGGITGMMKLAHMAEIFGMKFEPHHYGPVLAQAAQLHVSLAVQNNDFFEFPVPVGVFDQCMKDVIRIDREGYVCAPTKPGIGYDIDWDQLEKETVRVV